ncbi:hypothetical protein FK178_13020 [Antarcticibacterium arcticum]|uniref:Uncharacterized protein n=1 Tax=Antarcticibacterium arcticum TaxID=2585771 RepID=A0A5B8YL02_9FLAO|nr:hypothetical protein [Antarcticibacterium arcticum]QED38582.1 hypothetical protein FK178_13020 [Antarcticibacterium arcticum]
MKFPAFVVMLFFSSLLIAQETPDIKMHSSVLLPGELFNIGTRSIAFKEVISDSRCPAEVTCVWAGEARILLAIYENGKFRENVIVSTTSVNIPLISSAENILLSISGIDLLPYPSTRNKNTKPEYTLQLMLSEKL